MRIKKILLKKENFFLYVFIILAEYLSFFAAKGDALFLGFILVFSSLVFHFWIQFHIKYISRVRSLLAWLIFLLTIAATAVLVYTFLSLLDSVNVLVNGYKVFGHNILMQIIVIFVGIGLSIIFSAPRFFREGNPLR